MRTRIIVGLTGLVVVLGISWWGGFPFVLLAVAAALVGGYEFYWMLEQGGLRPQMVLGLIWLALLALSGWRPDWFPFPVFLTLGFFAAFIYALTIPDQPVHMLLATVVPAIYLGTMFSQAIALRMPADGFWWLLFAFAIAWGSDTAAYFAGTLLGRHKIWPRLSPKKTWEGTLAGWIGAGILAPVIVSLTPLEMPLVLAAVVGVAGGVLGFFGDLSISMIKRQVGVKDSGHFFPGHGGMLDRLDSMLFVLPYVYLVVTRLLPLFD